MKDSALRIAVLYPELLGTYGDTGNVLVLTRRLAWRALPYEVMTVSVDDPVPVNCDLYVVGGGEDDAQALALAGLRAHGRLARAVDDGAHVLAVCAGLQMLGKTIRDGRGQVHEGLGLLDIDTEARPTRAVGEVVATPDPELGLGSLTGFENHGLVTRLGPAARPLAKVRSGTGNGWEDSSDGDRHEGVLQGTVVATYLHGPVLARNPDLADLMLTRALGGPLAPLVQPAVDRLRRERLTARSTRPARPPRWSPRRLRSRQVGEA